MTAGDMLVVWHSSMNTCIPSFSKLILIRIAGHKLDLVGVEQVIATMGSCNSMGLYFSLWKRKRKSIGNRFL
jgi:hypothetical protein